MSDQVLIQLCASDLERVELSLHDLDKEQDGYKQLCDCAAANRFTVPALRTIQRHCANYSSASQECQIFVHELIERGKLHIPEPPPPPKRNPELEQRIQKLRKAQEADEYHSMTKDVDQAGIFNTAKDKDQNFAAEVRQINRQLTVVLNTVLTTAGAFMFGYKGLPMIFSGIADIDDVAIRAALGCTFATLVFFADLWFIAKSTM